jgi:tripeptidyl-peptidase-1
MYISSSQCLVLALSALPTAFSKSFSHHAEVPKGWKVHETARLASAGKQQVFSIALTMQNVDQLESKLLDLSSPDSKNYGQWLSQDDVTAAFSPSKDAVSSVTKWLKSNGVKHYKVNGGFIDFALDVKGANSLLGGDYQYYTKDGQTKLRTLSYSIPDTVAEHIQFVDPSTNFGGTVAFNPVPHPSRTLTERKNKPTKSSVDASCQTSITPSCLKQMYNIGDYTPKVESGSTIGFSSFLGQSALYSDVFLFEEKFGIPQQNFTTVLINNGTDDQNPAHKAYGEADLDAENIVGIAHPLPFTQYITGGAPYVILSHSSFFAPLHD